MNGRERARYETIRIGKEKYSRSQFMVEKRGE
jgi:hypothetical protein